MPKLEYILLYHSCFDFATGQVNITAKMCNFLKCLNQKLKLTHIQGLIAKGLRKRIPALYILVKNKFIAISIGDNPVVLCKRYSNIEKLQEVVCWIKCYKNTLLKHWQGELNDVETLNILVNCKNIELP